jgi:KDO2-lipid IV(A) lauroyltransferase
MNFKKASVEISRFFGWLGLGGCSLMVSVLPEKWLYGFAKNASKFGALRAARQKKIAMDSLTMAFGAEKTPDEIKRIAQDCFIFLVKAGMELMFLMERPRRLKERVRFVGKEHLERALKAGRGVILVSAHFGNFPLMLSRLSLEGYKVGGIMRPMRDMRVEKMFEKKRRRFNIRTIYSHPRKACVDATIRSLANNEIVFIPIDQNFGSGGVFVDFFGRKAATATGPVVLTQRTKAALIPCFIIRQPDDTHKIVFEPQFALERAGSAQETVVLNIQRLTNIIEDYIRRYPAEWGWIHRRWKSKPR